MTITHQGLAEEVYSLALTREVNLDTQSSESTAEEMRESGRTVQSLIVWGKKLFVGIFISRWTERPLSFDFCNACSLG